MTKSYEQVMNNIAREAHIQAEPGARVIFLIRWSIPIDVVMRSQVLNGVSQPCFALLNTDLMD